MADGQPSWVEGFLGEHENAPWPLGTLATVGRLGYGAVRGMGEDVAQQEREFTLARNSARDIAGPMSDRQQNLWELSYGVSPTALSIASPGSIYGVGGNTMRGLLRGAPRGRLPSEVPTAPRASPHVEISGLRSVSTTADPEIAGTFAGGNPARVFSGTEYSASRGCSERPAG